MGRKMTGTTVVANLQAMASDTRISCSPSFHTAKIIRHGDTLYGICGDLAVCLVLVDWLKSGKRSKQVLYKLISEEMRYETEILELSDQGLALWDGWGVRMPILGEFYAIGSGAPYAVQAIHDGADLEEAVRASCRFDPYTGLSPDNPVVTVEYLNPRKVEEIVEAIT